MSSKSIASLTWWVFPAGLAAYASAPIRELDPTVEIWTDASLERVGGHSSHGGFVQRSWTSSDLADDACINLLETRALLLWEQAVSRNVTLLPPQWIPTGGITAADFLQGTMWLSGYPCWTGGCSSPFWIFSVFNQVVPVLGFVLQAMAHIM